MASAWHGEEPELCTEPVVLECAVCGRVKHVDPADHEDEEEYVCLVCCAQRAKEMDTRH